MRHNFVYIISFGFEKSLSSCIKFLRATNVQDFRTVLSICYKSSLVYFCIKDVAEVDYGLERPVKRVEKRPKKEVIEAEYFATLFFPLKAMKVAFKDLDKATEVHFLQKYL